MATEKKSPNPFINLANAAKMAANNSRVSPGKAAEVQAAKFKKTVAVAKPVKKASGRGR